MNLRLIREPSLESATHGVLFTDGHFACFALEDVLREMPGQPVSAWKVPQQTAIPAGRYRVIVTPSQRFHCDLPLLVDVPGFTGVRIHPGNGPLDTEGCILVGQDRAPGRVLRSRLAFDSLFARIQAATETWIVVENPEV